MQIQGLRHVHGPQQVNAPHANHASQPAATESFGGPRADNVNIDQLEISPEADLVSRAREVPDIRQDRVNQIRNQIASGTYDSAEKLDVALDRLLDELA